MAFDLTSCGSTYLFFPLESVLQSVLVHSDQKQPSRMAMLYIMTLFNSTIHLATEISPQYNFHKASVWESQWFTVIYKCIKCEKKVYTSTMYVEEKCIFFSCKNNITRKHKFAYIHYSWTFFLLFTAFWLYIVKRNKPDNCLSNLKRQMTTPLLFAILPSFYGWPNRMAYNLRINKFLNSKIICEYWNAN